ncbi:hypothetical protein FTUN_7492 [Frigoriglobus tundricola]|uniref:Uncharacterized protein n=1 Tax=Frigoriglobus tundricola TaxID=2774151 RepID=A0A6M5Z0L0_9BACT|nr:hypothetical protein FTUN_7492 [Frigoriglobus tundricola]
MFPNEFSDPVRDPLMHLVLVPLAALVIVALVGGTDASARGNAPPPRASQARTTPRAVGVGTCLRRPARRPAPARRMHWRRHRKSLS